jgi:hypothetical protein
LFVEPSYNSMRAVVADRERQDLERHPLKRPSRIIRVTVRIILITLGTVVIAPLFTGWWAINGANLLDEAMPHLPRKVTEGNNVARLLKLVVEISLFVSSGLSFALFFMPTRARSRTYIGHVWIGFGCYYSDCNVQIPRRRFKRSLSV